MTYVTANRCFVSWNWRIKTYMPYKEGLTYISPLISILSCYGECPLSITLFSYIARLVEVTLYFSSRWCLSSYLSLKEKVSLPYIKLALYFIVRFDIATVWRKIIAGSLRVSLFIDMGCPSDLERPSGCFMIIRLWSISWFVYQRRHFCASMRTSDAATSSCISFLSFLHRPGIISVTGWICV